jgi:hypothetical protein
MESGVQKKETDHEKNNPTYMFLRVDKRRICTALSEDGKYNPGDELQYPKRKRNG